MPTDHIVALLIAERDKLNSAIEALQGTKTPATPAAEAPAAEARTPEKKRQISAAARRNMALGQRKRYASIKAKATTNPAVTPKAEPAHASLPTKKGVLTEAGRKALSIAMKKRWAAKKKAAAKAV